MKPLIEYFLLGICLSSVAAQNRSKTDVKANSFSRNTDPRDVSRSPAASGPAEPDAAAQELRDEAGKWNAWKPTINRMTIVSDENITKKETRNGQIDNNPVFGSEGPRARRDAESEAKEKTQAAVANEEKQSAVEEKKAEEKEKTKDRAKTEEIKEEADEEEEKTKREKKTEETAGNENQGKAKKRHYSFRDDEEDGDQQMKRSSFKRSNSNSKLSPVAKSDRNFKQKRNEIENIQDEEEEELENLLRQRKHKSRQAKDREDKRNVQRKKNRKKKILREKKHRRRRHQHSAPRRNYRNAGDSSSHRQQRQQYSEYDPLLHSEEELQGRVNRDVVSLSDDNSRQRRSGGQGIGGGGYKPRSRLRRFNEGFEFANDKEAHHMVEGSDRSTGDKLFEFYYDKISKVIGNPLGLNYEEDAEEEEEKVIERKARSAAADDGKARLRRLALNVSEMEERLRNYDGRARGPTFGGEMTKEHRKRASGDDDDDDGNVVTFDEVVYRESRVKRDHAVDGNEGKRGTNRRKRLFENEKFGEAYKDIDPKKMLKLGRRGKEQSGKTQPAEKFSN